MKLFVVTCAYRVPSNKVERYHDIQKRVKKIYLGHGCIGYEVFKGDDDLWLEVNKSKDKEHCENVKKFVGSDPRIETLWKEFCSIVEKEKIIARKHERML